MKGATTDLQIVGKTDLAASAGKRQFIPLETHDAEVQAVRAELTSMKAAVLKADEQATQRVAEFKRTYPLTLRRYQTQPMNVAPFLRPERLGR